MAPAECINSNGKLEKSKKQKAKKSGYLKNIKEIISSIEADAAVIGEVEEFIDHLKLDKSFDYITIQGLLLWADFDEVQGKPIARIKLAPICAAGEDFKELLSTLKKLPDGKLGKVIFTATIWNTSAKSFALQPGSLYSIKSPSGCKVWGESPQFSAKIKNFKCLSD